jgi:hypothetical protein
LGHDRFLPNSFHSTIPSNVIQSGYWKCRKVNHKNTIPWYDTLIRLKILYTFHS